MPMLNEEEFAGIARLHRDATLAVKEFRRVHGTSLKDTPLRDLYKPVRAECERMTGLKESNENTDNPFQTQLFSVVYADVHIPA